jgi:hypothetical protein
LSWVQNRGRHSSVPSDFLKISRICPQEGVFVVEAGKSLVWTELSSTMKLHYLPAAGMFDKRDFLKRFK